MNYDFIVNKMIRNMNKCSQKINGNHICYHEPEKCEYAMWASFERSWNHKEAYEVRRQNMELKRTEIPVI